jgi:anti-sigma regulatory factor (Ser/Thr protein kinase)
MSDELHLRLPRHNSAAGIARKAVDRRFAGELRRERAGDLVLVVSELVTNAVEHGLGAISLTVRVDDDGVFGEVVDEGGGFEREARERGPGDLRGRGLHIVDAVSSRWGVHEGTTHVWFELARRDAPAKPTGPDLGDAERPARLGAPRRPR